MIGRFAIRFIGVVLIFGMVLLCARADAASSGSGYGRLDNLFIQGKYGAVVDQAEAMLRSGSSRRDDVYYLKGLSELKLGRFKDARQSLGCASSGSSVSRRAFEAYLGIGDSYMLEGNLNAASGVYEGMLKDFSGNNNIKVVYARLARCYEGLGAADKARMYKDLAGGSVAQISAVQVNSPVRVMSVDASFSIQVGSFKSKKNAGNLARQLQSRGYEARVVMPVSADDMLFRVRVGSFATRVEAESAAGRLRDAGYSTKICASLLCE